MEESIREIVGADYSQRRIDRIPNGVDLPALTADAESSSFAHRPDLAGPFVLGLGRMIRRKGFDLLIDWFAPIAKAGWKLVLAGDGRELPALWQRADSFTDRILFTGEVDRRGQTLAAAALPIPGRAQPEESFGNVALEAMACGKPVLASNSERLCRDHHRRDGRPIDRCRRPGRLERGAAGVDGS